MEGLTELFRSDQAAREIDAVGVALRILLAGGLGCAVAATHRFAGRHRIGTPGLSSTLVLLSMLIAMVTLAIGDKAATAFTLVGTLAIVRFRTPVRDIRDTAFVIFAVAVGISVGALSPIVALVGTVVVGAAVVAMTLGDPAGEDVAAGEARIDIRLEADGPHDQVVEPVIRSHTRSLRLLVARDMLDGGTRLVYEADLDRRAASPLVDALRRLEPVRRVAVSFGLEAE